MIQLFNYSAGHDGSRDRFIILKGFAALKVVTNLSK